MNNAPYGKLTKMFRVEVTFAYSTIWKKPENWQKSHTALIFEFLILMYMSTQ